MITLIYLPAIQWWKMMKVETCKLMHKWRLRSLYIWHRGIKRILFEKFMRLRIGLNCILMMCSLMRTLQGWRGFMMRIKGRLIMGRFGWSILNIRSRIEILGKRRICMKDIWFRKIRIKVFGIYLLLLSISISMIRSYDQMPRVRGRLYMKMRWNMWRWCWIRLSMKSQSRMLTRRGLFILIYTKIKRHLTSESFSLTAILNAGMRTLIKLCRYMNKFIRNFNYRQMLRRSFCWLFIILDFNNL